jgi:hypothetical protein
MHMLPFTRPQTFFAIERAVAVAVSSSSTLNHRHNGFKLAGAACKLKPLNAKLTKKYRCARMQNFRASRLAVHQRRVLPLNLAEMELAAAQRGAAFPYH